MNRLSVAVSALVVAITVAGCGGVVKANHGGSTGSVPTVASLSPNNGDITGGTSVTIRGTNFLAGALVTFGGVQAQTVTVSSGTQIEAVTPPAAAGGPVDVTVRNPDGQSGTLGGGFRYTIASSTLTITSISPTSGPTDGGTSVQITGTNFLIGALVFFGSVQAQTVTVSSGTQIEAVTPPGAAETVDVTVQNPDYHAARLAAAFTYSPPDGGGDPTISAVSPTSGPPGTGVTITGTNFASGATVKFGSTDASSVSFVSSTQLEATVPSISTGTYDVSVTNPDPASATLHNGFDVTDPGPSDSLLRGCTVSASKTVQSCSGIPGGWSLATAEGFEGALGPNEELDFGPTISSVQKHTGSNSMRISISSCTPPPGQTCSPGGWWAFTNLGSGVHDVYVSWWSYLDPAARGNSDGYFAQLTKNTSIQHAEDLLMNIQAPNDQLVTVSSLWYAPTSNDPASDCLNTSKPKTCGKYGNSWTLNRGFWEQEEVWFHPGTCTGQTPKNDGFLRMYINGNLVYSLDSSRTFDPSPEGSGNNGGNPNGCLDMSSPSFVQVGGPWTYFVTNPVTWNKYVDDIIVMKK